jgi:hypothetical protein
MMHSHFLGGHVARSGQRHTGEQDRIGRIVDAIDGRADSQDGEYHRRVMQQRAATKHHQLTAWIGDSQLPGRVAA